MSVEIGSHFPDLSRAVWFSDARTVELREDVVREPGPGEVTVRARFSLISPGTEMLVYRGEIALPDSFFPVMEGSFDFPVKFGYQTVGTVVRVGEGATLTVGANVFCRYPHQEVFTLPEASTEPVPSDLTLDRAAFTAMFKVAVNCLLDVPIRPGEVVVVSGLGLIGTFCAVLARKMAMRLVLVEPSDTRRARAEWLGADEIVAPQEVSQALDRLGAPSGADIWIEASGNGTALQLAIKNTAEEATIAVPASYGSRDVTLQLNPEFHLRRLKIVSSWVGRVGSGLQPRWDQSRLTRVAMHHVREVDIDRIITHRIPLELASMAYQLIDEQPDETLGVVLVHG